MDAQGGRDEEGGISKLVQVPHECHPHDEKCKEQRVAPHELYRVGDDVRVRQTREERAPERLLPTSEVVASRRGIRRPQQRTQRYDVAVTATAALTRHV
jgi:hypothetical protein